jgi:hypothetical protein
MLLETIERLFGSMYWNGAAASQRLYEIAYTLGPNFWKMK